MTFDQVALQDRRLNYRLQEEAQHANASVITNFLMILTLLSIGNKFDNLRNDTEPVKNIRKESSHCLKSFPTPK